MLNLHFGGIITRHNKLLSITLFTNLQTRYRYYLDILISNFRISGQSRIKENCYNSKTNNDIDRKL